MQDCYGLEFSSAFSFALASTTSTHSGSCFVPLLSFQENRYLFVCVCFCARVLLLLCCVLFLVLDMIRDAGDVAPHQSDT